MHMADALISPSVGAAFWAASAYLTAKSSVKLKNSDDGEKTALMGVLSAFVFASQMINFSIPGTGSSGHIGGGLLLAIFLGPERAFLSIVSILAVQALFFADGGLLALGCNIFNMGFFPCFIAYPFIYKKITDKIEGKKGIFWGAVIAAAVGLEFGAFFVVLETIMSGVTSLPINLFMLFMLPVHLAIGLVEGIGTGLIVTYIYVNMPDALKVCEKVSPVESMRRAVLFFSILAVLTCGIFAWYASSSPDGLEWSIEGVLGSGEELKSPVSMLHRVSEVIQEKSALLPDYAFKNPGTGSENIGTSVSGLVGSAATLVIALMFGLLFRRRNSSK